MSITRGTNPFDGSPYGLPSGEWENLTPLWLAAGDCHTDIVRELIAAGADIEAAEGGSGWRPLYMAAMHGRSENVRALVDAGAEVNARAHGNMTALHQGRPSVFLMSSRSCSMRERM